MPVQVAEERGQVVPLVVVMLLMVGVLAVAVARVGVLLDDAARARTAADAAALAGAAHGEAAAARMAESNDGRLEHYRRHGDVVEVTVRVGRATATARARMEISWEHPTGTASGPGFGPMHHPRRTPTRMRRSVGDRPVHFLGVRLRRESDPSSP